MFRTMKKLVKGTVTVAGEVVRVGTKTVSTVTTGLAATSTETLVGKNAFSDALRKVNRGVGKATDVMVDWGTPLAARIAGAPFTKAEHLKEVVWGALETASPEKREQGLERLRKVAPYAAVSIATLGLLDEDDLMALLDFLGTDEAVAAAAEATGETLAAADPAAGLVETVADTGPPDAAAASTLAAVSTDAPHAVGSYAVRFSGETVDQVIKRLMLDAQDGRPEMLRNLLHKVMQELPADAHETRDQVQEAINGAFSQAPRVLALADPLVNVDKIARGVRFGGGT